MIFEQEKDGKSWEVVQGIEASLKKYTIQVLKERLGLLKDFIIARNSPSLEKAIQAAREQDRTTHEETKKLYRSSQKSV